MDRREAAKRISALMGIAISGPTMAGILGGCQASPQGNLRTLTAHQHTLLDVMTEHIIPTTDSPGASAAKVADYIDAMLTDFYSEERRASFLVGLKETEEATKSSFGKSFLNCSAKDQRTLLTRLDQEAFPDLSAMDEAALEAHRQQREEEGKPFIATLKELTLAGYYTSETGATQELHVNPMGVHRGDIPYEEIGKAWA